MAVYRHFENRAELIAAVAEEAFAAWKEQIDALAIEHPLAWLRAAGQAYIAFAFDQPARFDACFVLRTKVERRYPEDFAAGKSPAVSMARIRVEEAQALGLVGGGDSLEATMLFWAQLHGLAMLHRSGRFAMDRDAFMELCARCADAALAGFGGRS